VKIKQQTKSAVRNDDRELAIQIFRQTVDSIGIQKRFLPNYLGVSNDVLGKIIRGQVKPPSRFCRRLTRLLHWEKVEVLALVNSVSEKTK